MFSGLKSIVNKHVSCNYNLENKRVVTLLKREEQASLMLLLPQRKPRTCKPDQRMNKNSVTDPNVLSTLNEVKV